MLQTLKRTVRPVYWGAVRPTYVSAKGLLDHYRALYRIRAASRHSPLKIVIGAEGIYPSGWTPTEIGQLNLLKPEHWQRFFRENSIDAILMEHVWHYLTREETFFAALLCYKYLKPDGYLRVAVPDGLHPDPEYIEWVRPGGPRSSAKDHKFLFTYKTFAEAFEFAGFHVELLEYYDEQGQFHFTEWDPADGMIYRSLRFDYLKRPIKATYTSLILDARKPA